MSYLDQLDAEVTALKSSIFKIDQDFKDQIITPQFYYGRRNALIRDSELAIKKLESVLNENGAPEVARALSNIRQENPDDSLLRSQLEIAAEAGQSKGWGETIQKVLKYHKGSMVNLVISAAIKVAKTFFS